MQAEHLVPPGAKSGARHVVPALLAVFALLPPPAGVGRAEGAPKQAAGVLAGCERDVQRLSSRALSFLGKVCCI